MQAVLIRRALVFGVCAAGVGALYVAADASRAPAPAERLSGRPSTSVSSVAATVTVRPVSTRTQAASEPPDFDRDRATGPASVPARTAAAAEPIPPAGDRGDGSARGTGPTEPATTAAETPPARSTPYDRRRDDTPPAAVLDVSIIEVTHEAVTLDWEPVRDDVGVVGYRVSMDGFDVAASADSASRAEWLSDEGGQHVLQVRAEDAAGNQSIGSRSYLIARPPPGQTVRPTPDTPPSASTRSPSSNLTTAAPEPSPVPTPSPTR